MADYEAALISALAGRQKQLQESNPFLQAAPAIAGVQLQQPGMNWKDSFMLSLAQGLAAGITQGYGERQVKNRTRELTSALSAALAQENPVGALEANPELAEFAPYVQLSELQRARDVAAENQKKATEFGYQQLGAGRVFDPQSGRFYPAAGYAETEGANKSAITRADKIAGYQVDQQYAPGLEAAKTSAQEAAKLPYVRQQEAIKAAAQYKNPGAIADYEAALRQELKTNVSVQNLNQVEPIFQSMVQSLNDSGPAADLDFIYGAAKIFDPPSVAREGEMVLVKSTGGLPQIITGALESLRGGAQLSPELKRSILEVTQRRVNAIKAQALPEIQERQRLATERGANPANVWLRPIPEFAIPKGPPPTPRPGFVIQFNQKTGEYREVPSGG